MKRRVRKIANFFAFNLLFFALYLNFIHKDKAAVNFVTETAKRQNAAFGGTVMLSNPQQSSQKETAPVVEEKAPQASTAALKLSIN